MIFLNEIQIDTYLWSFPIGLGINGLGDMLLVWKFMLKQVRVRCKIFKVFECEREVMMEQLEFSFSIFRVFRNI